MSEPANPGKDLQDYIDAQVKAGRYEDHAAGAREALRLLKFRDRYMAELDAALERGLAQAEAGLGTPIEEVAAKLKAKYRAMAREQRHRASR